MTIGNIQTDNYAALAPMAGVADRAFRELCMSFGAAFCTSEMVSAKGINYGDEKSKLLMKLSEGEMPSGIQLFGNTPADFEKAVPTALSFSPAFIDINMGCPAPKVTKNGSGSALMKNPELCGEIVASAVKVSDVPITVKIRKGWDDDSITAVETAKLCEAAGAAAVTVHGRTTKQMYAPPTDIKIIKSVENAIKIPVIGNGDITSGKEAAKMYSETGCALVAVGRGALGRPWIFASINAFMRGEEYTEPDIREKMDIMLEHAARICEYKGDRVGMNEARKHAIWYTKGLRGGAAYRNALAQITSLDELKKISCNIIAENI